MFQAFIKALKNQARLSAIGPDPRTMASSYTRMVGAFIMGGVVFYSVQLLSRFLPTQKVSSDKSSRASSPARTEGKEASVLKREQLSRNEQFFGREAQEKIEAAFVVVVGVGGVGSHAAHMLARAGVKRIRVVDFDQVTLSSLNRHAVATRADVGLPKAVVLATHISRFAPWCEVDAQVAMFEERRANELLEGDPDYVLDCIDDIKTKLELLSYCCANSLRVISSMGAGAKADPTRMQMVELEDIVEDPLACRIRWQLNKWKHGQEIKQVETVFSSEKPHMKLLPLELRGEEEKPEDFGALPSFRVRVIPVLGTMPALFGIAMASRVLSNLAEKPFEPAGFPSMTEKTCNRLHQRYRSRVRRVFGSDYPVDNLDSADIDFLIIQWKRRCCITFTKWNRSSGFELAQWRHDRPVAVGNTVLLKKEFASVLDDLVLKRKDPTPAALNISQEHFDAIEARLKSMKRWNPAPKDITSLWWRQDTS